MRNLIQPINVENFDMVRNAKVEVKKLITIPHRRDGAEGHPTVSAIVTVNDRYVHEFSRSPVYPRLLSRCPKKRSLRV